MLNNKFLSVIRWIKYNSDSCLVIDNFSIIVELNIVSAIKTTISKNIFNLYALIWWLLILQWNFCLLCSLFPRGFCWGCALLTHNFFQLEIIILYSMFNALFNLTDVFLALFIVPLHFFADIRINKVINIFLIIHLPFGDKAYIKHPLFIVLVLEANFGKLGFIKHFVFVKIILLEFVFIYFLYLFFS